jgi:hypothetical protein
VNRKYGAGATIMFIDAAKRSGSQRRVASVSGTRLATDSASVGTGRACGSS